MRKPARFLIPTSISSFVPVLLISSISILALTACESSNGKSTKAISVDSTPKNGAQPDDQKTVQKTPPLFNSDLWLPGTSWTWQEMNGTEAKPFCLRWTVVTNSQSGGVLMESRRTAQCGQFEGTSVRRFQFFPRDGVVNWEAMDSQAAQTPNPAWSIYGMLFGDESAANFVKRPITTPWGRLTGYQIADSDRWYIEAPGTLLQGVLWQSGRWRLLEFKAGSKP